MARFLTGMTRTTLMGIAIALVIAPAALAQRVDPSTVYLYKGADRDQRLLDAAKKEGTLTFYTSMQTPESGPLSAAFEKKYGIKVNLWRATSDQVIQRAITEARGNRNTMDVVETNAPEVEALGREGVVAEYFSPHFKDFPDWALPAHHKWTSARANLWIVAFNTNKVKREDIPKTYDGFADPKWRGRIGIEFDRPGLDVCGHPVSRRGARHGHIPQALGAQARHAAWPCTACRVDRGRRSSGGAHRL